jgi:hypothetical protein
LASLSFTMEDYLRSPPLFVHHFMTDKKIYREKGCKILGILSSLVSQRDPSLKHETEQEWKRVSWPENPFFSSFREREESFDWHYRQNRQRQTCTEMNRKFKQYDQGGNRVLDFEHVMLAHDLGSTEKKRLCKLHPQNQLKRKRSIRVLLTLQNTRYSLHISFSLWNKIIS